MRYTTSIATILLAVLLVACATEEPANPEPKGTLAGAYSQATTVYTYTPQVDPNTSITQAANGVLTVKTSFVNESNRTITILGRNSTGAVKEILSFNGSSGRNTSLNLTQVDSVILNGTATGYVTIQDARTNATVVNLSPNMTVAYTVRQYNGTNYAIPALNSNGSIVDVSTQTEYAVYTACGTYATTNATFSYWVSPDGNRWFTGAASLPSCNNSQAKTTITDTGVRYIKLGVNNPDNASNQIYVKLVAK